MDGKLFYYNNFIGFIGIHFIVAYIKKYLVKTTQNSKIGIQFMVLGIIGWIVQNALTVKLGLHFELFAHQAMRWNRISNPCFILIALGAFFIAKKHVFYNKVINYLSSLSLLIYIIHCNRVIRDYIRYDFFEYVMEKYSYNSILLWVFAFAGISLLAGTIMAIIYHETVQKFIHKISIFLADLVKKTYGFYEGLILRLT